MPRLLSKTDLTANAKPYESNFCWPTFESISNVGFVVTKLCGLLDISKIPYFLAIAKLALLMPAIVAFVKSTTLANTSLAASVVSVLTLMSRLVLPVGRLQIVIRSVSKLLGCPVASSTKLAFFPLVSLTTTLITPVWKFSNSTEKVPSGLMLWVDAKELPLAS